MSIYSLEEAIVMKRVLFLCLCISVLLGCSGPRSPYNYMPQEKVANYGEIGKVKDVLEGDNIIHYHVEKVADVVKVHAPLNMAPGIFVGIYIPEGIYQKTGEDASKIYFKPKSIRREEIDVTEAKVTDLIYLKDDNALTVSIEKGSIMRSFKSGFTLMRNARLKELQEDEYMRSLSYGGSHKNLVSFEYREGDNKQRVTHNMNKGNIFTYQGAEVEIISYDDHSLTCKVLKGFDVFR